MNLFAIVHRIFTPRLKASDRFKCFTKILDVHLHIRQWAIIEIQPKCSAPTLFVLRFSSNSRLLITSYYFVLITKKVIRKHSIWLWMDDFVCWILSYEEFSLFLINTEVSFKIYSGRFPSLEVEWTNPELPKAKSENFKYQVASECKLFLLIGKLLLSFRC